MSSSRKYVVLSALALAAVFAATAFASEPRPPGYYGFGATPTNAEIEGWAIAARPDGEGLPPGKGSVQEGVEIYVEQCAACHGTFGEGEGRYPKLVGGELTGDRPEPTVGSYWPYAVTLFDYINRAMPFPSPHALSADQVYAMTAYILNLNNIVDNNFVADRTSLPKVKMPRQDFFIWQDPRPDTSSNECMNNCIDPKTIMIELTAEGKNSDPADHWAA